MKSTIEDVARLAGVSITTVSRAINNNYPVKEETRRKIDAAIEELQFTPNVLARGLIQKKSETIGVVVPSLTNLFFTQVVKGIQSVVQSRGYTLILSDTEGDAEAEAANVKKLLEHRVDGMICIDSRTANIKNGFYDVMSRDIPLVIINGYSDGVNLNFVLCDQESGTREALRHLLELGHTSIGLLRGGSSYSHDLKEEVFRSEMQQRGLEVDERSIMLAQYHNSIQAVDNSCLLVQRRLGETNPPTAIFACNDWLAMGAMAAAQREGLTVPEELSVIGFDNIIVSELSHPKLTTVDQNMLSLGRISAERLFEIMAHSEGEVKKMVLDTKLVVRGTTTKPHQLR